MDSRASSISDQMSTLHTEDPVKSMETIAHSVRLQGSALVSYRLERQTARRATSPSECDRYIYSGSQRVCAVLIRCFSGPSASEGL